MTDLDVFIDPIDTAGPPRRVGTAHITRLRGRVSTTFLYHSGYLTEGGAGIDPSPRPSAISPCHHAAIFMSSSDA